ncbi:MAG: 3D domain-containing protein [Peptostreptococcaceae bacterium]
MIKKVVATTLSLACIVGVLQTTEVDAASNKTGKVTVSALNVRSGPSVKYKVIGKLKKGNKVTILKSSKGWHKVRLSNKKEGWVSDDYIKKTTSSSKPSSSSSKPSTSKKPSKDKIKKTVKVQATAYTGYSTTSTGQKPKWGTIAVDPKVIPYGTKVYIPKFNQVFVANNTGGAIKGNKIDIYMNSRKECYDWGRRTIEIQILK